jgi:hypothetical protein
VCDDLFDFPLDLFWQAHAWALGLGLVATSVLALRRGLRMGCLDRKVFAVSLCVWVAFMMGVIAVWMWGLAANATTPLWAVALSSGFLVLPLGAVAMAPLALARLRHQ